MLSALLAAGDFVAPKLDFHAFGPELILSGAVVLVLVADLIKPEGNPLVPSLAGIGVLAAGIPIITLAVDGASRSMFDGAFVVDDFALVLKGLFLISAYVVILMSTNYIAEGDYAEGEYYVLVLSSTLGMVLMASSRDLLTMFVALELLSIPAYMLAGWRKRDFLSNEGGVKYYLMGVFASAVMLYGMSLLYGIAGDTRLSVIGEVLADRPDIPLITLAIVFVIVGFAFKVSAVPFHTWAPDTYQGAPTPITAFLAVSSKAAGFVALLQLVFVAFAGRLDVIQPLMWVLSVATMTVGNLIALRQTNVIRVLAYSGVAQAGFMLAPFAVGSETDLSAKAVITYLVIYAAMNLGAFAVVMAVARKTGSAELSSFGGLFAYAPGLGVTMALFLFSLAGIPPMGGFFAKFVVFRALADAATPSAIALAVAVAVNSVIALYYYANIARQMFFNPPVDGDVSPIRVPFALSAAITMTLAATVLFGVSNVALEIGDRASFLVLGG